MYNRLMLLPVSHVNYKRVCIGRPVMLLLRFVVDLVYNIPTAASWAG